MEKFATAAANGLTNRRNVPKLMIALSDQKTFYRRASTMLKFYARSTDIRPRSDPSAVKSRGGEAYCALTGEISDRCGNMSYQIN